MRGARNRADPSGARRSRLDAAVIPLPPFEMLGGSHPADATTAPAFLPVPLPAAAPQRRRLRPGRQAAAADDRLSRRNRDGDGTTSQGRDLNAPDAGSLSFRVLSLVPADARDIRDASDAGLAASRRGGSARSALRIAALGALRCWRRGRRGRRPRPRGAGAAGPDARRGLGRARCCRPRRSGSRGDAAQPGRRLDPRRSPGPTAVRLVAALPAAAGVPQTGDRAPAPRPKAG